MNQLEYRIEYTEKAIKYFESLEKKEAERLFKKIEAIKSNPLHFIEKLTGVGLWKLRIGDYRAIIRLNIAGNIISVVDIGHRRNIYKNL